MTLWGQTLLKPRRKRPSSIWTQHLNPKEQESFEETLYNSRFILSRLRDILKEDMQVLNRAEITTTDFDNPNWTYRQAARLGEKARLSKVLQLLEFLD